MRTLLLDVSKDISIMMIQILRDLSAIRDPGYQADDKVNQSVPTTEYSTTSVEPASKYAGISMMLRKAIYVAPIGETGRKYNNKTAYTIVQGHDLCF